MNYIPVLPQKDSSIKEIPEITAKKIFDQSCDTLAAAVSESQIDMDDFSAFENISKRHITVTDPNFQLTHGRDISENLTLSYNENTSLNPRENRIDYPTNKESLKENEKAISERKDNLLAKEVKANFGTCPLALLTAFFPSFH